MKLEECVKHECCEATIVGDECPLGECCGATIVKDEYPLGESLRGMLRECPQRLL